MYQNINNNRFDNRKLLNIQFEKNLIEELDQLKINEKSSINTNKCSNLKNIFLDEKYLSKDIVNRKKHGFALPVSDLIKTKLKDRFEDVLFDANNPAAKLFNHSEVKRLWNEHQQNKVDHRKKLWSLYTLYKVLDNYSAIN